MVDPRPFTSWPASAAAAVNGHNLDTLEPPHTPAAPTATPVPVSVDYTVVTQLSSQISRELTELLGDSRNVSAEQRQAEGERLAAERVREYTDLMFQGGVAITPAEERALLDAVAADLFGLGRLQPLLDRDDVVNIHILGHDRVRLEHTDGRITVGPPVADDDRQLVEMLQVLAGRAGTERALSSAKPWLDLEMSDDTAERPGGSRLAVITEVSDRPYVTIRRHTLVDVTLERLRDEFGAIDELVCQFLKAAMAARLNIMIAGLAAAGKTTMLRALASEIPSQEPFVTLEQSRELFLHKTGRHPYAMSLEAREGFGALNPNGVAAGTVALNELIPRTLRMSVHRIIVGEVLASEVYAMLQAMTTSQGSMCTIHAREPDAVIDRVIELGRMAGAGDADLIRRMAGNAIDLIVYITSEDETALGGKNLRYVSNIVEVHGMTGDRLVTTNIFGPGPDGRAVPRHLPERILPRLARVGYDPRILTAYAQQGDANQGAWTQPLHRLTKVGFV